MSSPQRTVTLAFQPDTATLSVVLASEVPTVADVRFVADALDGLVAAGVWGALAPEEPQHEAIQLARSILAEEVNHPKAGSRFFPSWPRLRDPESDDPQRREPRFDPFDPMDAAVRDGLNSFLRRALWNRDPDLYALLFGFAVVQRVEHHSPLLIELAVVLTGAILLPALLTAGVMRAVVSGRKAQAEAQIREAEAEIREEELRQKKLQTRILEEIAAAAEQLGPTRIPRAAIERAAQVSTTSVADLGSSPLVGSVTVGFSSGSK